MLVFNVWTGEGNKIMLITGFLIFECTHESCSLLTQPFQVVIVQIIQHTSNSQKYCVGHLSHVTGCNASIVSSVFLDYIQHVQDGSSLVLGRLNGVATSLNRLSQLKGVVCSAHYPLESRFGVAFWLENDTLKASTLSFCKLHWIGGLDSHFPLKQKDEKRRCVRESNTSNLIFLYSFYYQIFIFQS